MWEHRRCGGWRRAAWGVLLLALVWCGGAASAAGAGCALTEATREFRVQDPAISGDREKHTGVVLTLENARIIAEAATDAGGNIIRFGAKNAAAPGPFCRLDDNFSACGTWRGTPYTHQVLERGPQHAAVVFRCTGALTPFAPPGPGTAPTPAHLSVERTMSIDGETTRLRVDVKITHHGGAPIPAFRYMAHAVYSYKTLPGATVYAFLPTATGCDVLDHELIVKANMLAQQAGEGHPFRRWSLPGTRLDKARYPALGWLAMYSDSGRAYLYYDPAQFDFVSFWSGTHPAEWLTLEPHTKAVDLRSGQSVTFSFTLALSAADVAFSGSTLLFEAPAVAFPRVPAGRLSFRVRGTTVRDQPETTEIQFVLHDAQARSVLDTSAGGPVRPFLFTAVTEEWELPKTLVPGPCRWAATSAEGVALGGGVLVWPPAESAPAKAVPAVPAVPAPAVAPAGASAADAFPPAAWANAVGMQFVRIPAGTFSMGSAADAPGAQPDEMPQHQVRITRAFLMAKYETTNAQFRKFRPEHHSAADPWHVLKKPAVDGDDQPALTTHNIVPAMAFIAWLNQTDTTKPAGWEYRLPTEAEWEYAARGSDGRRYPWGDAWADNRCRFGDQALAAAKSAEGVPGTAPVGSFSPAGDSPFGVCDLAGNVWEWCEDFYDPEFYRRSPADDPVCRKDVQGNNLVGEDSEVAKHVLRGGSWGSLAGSCRATFRYAPCSTHAPTYGIRVVLAPVRVAAAAPAASAVAVPSVPATSVLPGPVAPAALAPTAPDPR